MKKVLVHNQLLECTDEFIVFGKILSAYNAIAKVSSGYPILRINYDQRDQPRWYDVYNKDKEYVDTYSSLELSKLISAMLVENMTKSEET